MKNLFVLLVFLFCGTMMTNAQNDIQRPSSYNYTKGIDLAHEHNQYFLATIKIHEAFIDEDAYLKKIGKERDVEAENVLENVLENKCADLTERQRIILNLIRENSTISQEQMSKNIGVTIKTIQRDLKAMNHIVKRVGGDKGGYWEILIS